MPINESVMGIDYINNTIYFNEYKYQKGQDSFHSMKIWSKQEENL